MGSRACLFVFVLCLTGSLSAQFALPTKQVAAPGEEILEGHLRLPDPAAAATRSVGALLDVRFDRQGVFEASLPVEGDGTLRLIPLTATPNDWRVLVAEPGGALRAAAAWRATGRGETRAQPLGLGFGMENAWAEVWELRTAVSGSWRVRIEGLASAAGGVAAARGALLALGAHDERVLVTQLAHWDLVAGARPALLARMERRGAPGVALAGALTTPPELLVERRGVEPLVLPMWDDGRHQDGAAADGLWGVELPTDQPGTLQLRVVARGVTAEGEFLRTALRAVPIHAASVELLGWSMARVTDPLHLELGIAARVDRADRALQVSAELWGTTPEGEQVPVVWLSRMTTPSAEGSPHLALELDLRWLARAGAGAPLSLRAVRVQDPDSSVPLARLASLAVPGLRLPEAARGAPGPVSASMLTGFTAGIGGVVPPLAGTRPFTEGVSARLPDPVGPLPVEALLLSHGYCAGLAWPLNQFSGERIVLDDQNQNRSHDQFAQIMGAAGLAADSFGVVAHSQGGAAALHLLTYYMSGLDLASGGRRIQSVGTPYQGTPLAGGLAIFGQIFGAGCGSNDDMATDGAVLWLAGIPNWARAEVHYWTTSNSGSACNFLSGLFLSNPEDGVIERDRGQLPGANSMGHVTGWCHTTGMSDPAQYHDSARNAEMDAAASR